MSDNFRTDDGFDFNNDEFAQVAAFVKDLILPTEDELLEEEMSYQINTYAPEPEFVNITSGMELLKVTHNDINDRVVMGFPSIEPRGLMVNVLQSVGVSSATKSPTVCKSFVNMLVGEDFQTLFAKYDGISVNSAAQEAACRSFAERTNYAFEAISAVWTIENIQLLQVFDTTVDADEFVAQMDGYIRNASGIRINDYAAVENIIREEIQAYFADQKTIEEVMDIIQNRVDTYVDERG
jgi:ABC-type glycerol-3-phosphate transport system substrate-binding protein